VAEQAAAAATWAAWACNPNRRCDPIASVLCLAAPPGRARAATSAAFMLEQQEAPQGAPPPPGDEEPEFDFEGAFERLAGAPCRCERSAAPRRPLSRPACHS